ncbi:hypothetical protein PPL_08345 [Heterostelium album PN500]|uniref:Uncharacterized protein n=1 Tax=Heterostelium pallidum (strain ATCC 26659 / Pp 5 / PN500) TaxID=670386 RepID=D3BHX7_HETP5|nr:hypothetical protein PPL_08345 [Heterostelium album PN500]EFA78877.1 hypothetical protein PPL_08345 [Heterostelium album PN500]|eukprot:XP_020431001.1 hypothetical protein PPL_08345 [Heterostelium album PN500]
MLMKEEKQLIHNNSNTIFNIQQQNNEIIEYLNNNNEINKNKRHKNSDIIPFALFNDSFEPELNRFTLQSSFKDLSFTKDKSFVYDGEVNKWKESHLKTSNFQLITDKKTILFNINNVYSKSNI